MKTPLMPRNEAVRLAALQQLDILDTQSEERFDRLTRIAKNTAKCSIALVSLVDANRQWFKSKQGLDACETSRDISFCGHAILEDALFYIPDTWKSEYFADNPLVTGAPHIRSYAGFPIKTLDGLRIGTLCVIDTKPSHYNQAQLAVLTDLAACVENEINQQSIKKANATLQKSERQLNTAINLVTKYNQTLEKLHSITATKNFTFEDKISKVLLLGRETFKLSLGVVSEISENNYKVAYSSALKDAPVSGTTYLLSETFCHQTFLADKPIGFHHAGKSPIKNHPCYQQFKLESYLGAPIIVYGQRYGTLNFSDPHPKHQAFSEQDYSLIKLFAQWVSVEFERAHNLKELVRSKELAEQHNKAKSEFLNVMSHELRTPLTVILGYLPLLQNKDSIPADELIVSIAKDMETAGTQLMHLINDLLDLSKIEAEKLTLHLQEINIDTLLAPIISSFSEIANSKGISLIKDLNCDTVIADPIRLKQIIYNLISNAIKFTEHGTITLSAKTIENGVSFAVSDTGNGIAANELDHIFERFYQVDSSSTRKGNGSGLGLAITQKLVELHHGSIKVESQEGLGTQFIFTIHTNQEH